MSETDEPARVDGRAERGEATRAALVGAARKLFSERGYAAVGTTEVVEAAGVTRGAMYHHFADKKALFRAVYEQTEQDVVDATVASIAGVEDPIEQLRTAVRSFFDACSDPALMQIGLVDGPAVLGWQEWREIGTRYALGITTTGLQAAMDAGTIRRANVTQLAHLLIGALGEAAMLIANAADPVKARKEIEPTALGLLEGLRT